MSVSGQDLWTEVDIGEVFAGTLVPHIDTLTKRIEEENLLRYYRWWIDTMPNNSVYNQRSFVRQQIKSVCSIKVFINGCYICMNEHGMVNLFLVTWFKTNQLKLTI